MGLRIALACLALGLSGCATQQVAQDAASEDSLRQAVASDHRSAGERARDQFRHPVETLSFFGIRPDMTVVEVWPGSGWYTEILAPFLRPRGQLYAAQLDPAASDYARGIVEKFSAKLAARPDLFDNVIVTSLAAPPAPNAIAPPGSADMVVTFRNLHNWMMFGWHREAIEAMHRALKPGGVLGIVEHRGDPELPQDPKALSGYVDEDVAIELIESVGFKLVDRSEINANPKDSKDYEKGVWTLPPTYAAGEENRERYAQIGESDRFTLKFVKLAQ